jgi:hypothetical protein
MQKRRKKNKRCLSPPTGGIRLWDIRVLSPLGISLVQLRLQRSWIHPFLGNCSRGSEAIGRPAQGFGDSKLLRQVQLNCFGKIASTFPIDKEASEEMLRSVYLALVLPSTTTYSEQFFARLSTLTLSSCWKLLRFEVWKLRVQARFRV